MKRGRPILRLPDRVDVQRCVKALDLAAAVPERKVMRQHVFVTFANESAIECVGDLVDLQGVAERRIGGETTAPAKHAASHQAVGVRGAQVALGELGSSRAVCRDLRYG